MLIGAIVLRNVNIVLGIWFGPLISFHFHITNCHSLSIGVLSQGHQFGKFYIPKYSMRKTMTMILLHH